MPGFQKTGFPEGRRLPGGRVRTVKIPALTAASDGGELDNNGKFIAQEYFDFLLFSLDIAGIF